MSWDEVDDIQPWIRVSGWNMSSKPTRRNLTDDLDRTAGNPYEREKSNHGFVVGLGWRIPVSLVFPICRLYCSLACKGEKLCLQPKNL